ncbi:8-amino-7-oxononanoate synthase [Candidatus Roizmanbacteria bacterium RIFCSPLOWO2_02_FULL_36_11]|uniref:8-amino-7-oxononanoate synthase n=1 Tax=Candidatus Roizmanbacteria bacterium RIFCSPLOWO2_02_FULL_36_11 TaxID=1802071 RepID=A0A1F7JIE8_9BACT|nr:MAG: 8-amino-7-oxononanoate synthase [Candidatus Roizmanbacteria bacterium RIFCSPLOWO2_02_FULL_36_11]
MNKQLIDFITENYNRLAPPVRVIQSGEGAYLKIDGKKVLNLCSSHYLGLAVDTRLRKAAASAVDKYGLGTGYRTLAGTHELHVKLENAIAKFKNAEGAIILSGGYLANMTAIQTIFGKDDIVISDELNHASIIDAIRLAGIKNKYIYKHRDMKHLEEILVVIASDGRTSDQKILIVTDGVFSMDGDLAPLPEIIRLAKKYGAITMVDDAHGEGVMGRGGRGTADHLKVAGQIDLEVGTLSKAFSVMGGFITGKKELINFYKQKSRQFLFSNALSIPDTAALIEAVKILSKSDALVKKLWRNTNFLKKELKKAGFDIGGSVSPITPIMLGDEDLAVKFASELFAQGVFATSIRFPMVAKGKARIRLIPSASHSKADLEFAINQIINVSKAL